jgi:hypothetical protein
MVCAMPENLSGPSRDDPAELRRADAILTQTELAAAHAARRCGVHVSLVYSVRGADGKIYWSNNFRDAAAAGRRMTVGSRRSAG